MQTTSTIIMIRPINFGFNEQTAESNVFQRRQQDEQQAIHDNALAEFDLLVEMLRANEVDVMVIQDKPEPHTPDAIFPNNWISFHEDGKVFLYPMQAENRRKEKRQDIVDQLKSKYTISEIIDLSYFENKNKFLEGTGSMVLDRVNKIAYACRSMRTDQTALNRFCALSGYRAFLFNAIDTQGINIYHTNVMMCIGTHFAVVCLTAIADKLEKEKISHSLKSNNQEIIEISLDQMQAFAGNMLQLKNKNNESLLVMSSTARRSLYPEQIQQLEKYCKLIYSPINTIENIGGGSVRCMMAEVHLPLKC